MCAYVYAQASYWFTVMIYTNLVCTKKWNHDNTFIVTIKFVIKIYVCFIGKFIPIFT